MHMKELVKLEGSPRTTTYQQFCTSTPVFFVKLMFDIRVSRPLQRFLLHQIWKYVPLELFGLPPVFLYSVNVTIDQFLYHNFYETLFFHMLFIFSFSSCTKNARRWSGNSVIYIVLASITYSFQLVFHQFGLFISAFDTCSVRLISLSTFQVQQLCLCVALIWVSLFSRNVFLISIQLAHFIQYPCAVDFILALCVLFDVL